MSLMLVAWTPFSRISSAAASMIRILLRNPRSAFLDGGCLDPAWAFIHSV